MICSLVCWRLISISAVYFTRHQKDDSGGLAVAGLGTVLRIPSCLKLGNFFTTHTALSVMASYRSHYLCFTCRLPSLALNNFQTQQNSKFINHATDVISVTAINKFNFKKLHFANHENDTEQLSWKCCINWISTKSTLWLFSNLFFRISLWETLTAWAHSQALWCGADVALALTSCPYDAGAKMAQVPHHLQSWAAGSCTVQDVNGANSSPLLTFLIITKVSLDSCNRILPSFWWR